MGIELARAFINIRADASSVASDIRGAESGAVAAVGDMAGALRGAMQGVMGLAAGSSIVGMLYKAGEFEATQIAFETMIGSVEETEKTLSALTEFAALTPFEMPEILQASRGLIQFGERGDDLMKTLNMLGNAASGANVPFGMVALVFNQIRGVGKLLTQDFRQLSTRGILSLADIAKYYGITTEAAQKMLSTGKIGFEDVRGILDSLSKEGGRFYRLMERQSKSLLGLWSTLKDSINLVKREIGTGLMPIAKQIEVTMIDISESIREWTVANRDVAAGIASIVAAAIALPAIGMVVKALKFAFSGIGPTLFRIVTMLFSLKGLIVGAGIAAVVYGGVTAFKKLGLSIDHVKAAMILLGDLAKSVGDFFMAVWEIASTYFMEAWNAAINYVSDLLEPWKQSISSMVDTLVSNLDVMLGSWEGLREGIIYYSTQAVLGFQAIWATAVNFLAVKILEMKGLFIDLWYALGEMGIKYAMPTMARIFVWFNKKMDAMQGKEWTTTPEEEEAIIADEQNKALGAMGAKRAKNQKEVEDAKKILGDEYNKKMAGIGDVSIEVTKEWMAKMQKMPKLSEKWKAAMDAVRGAVGEVPGIDKPELPGGPAAGAGAIAAAKKRDWAFSGSVGVGDLGRTIQDALLKPDDKNLKAIEKGNDLQAKANDNLVAIRDKLTTGVLT